ncbi:hypothetical protein NDU88_001927 [Pleurodeles waltl]|uniref:Uncharacterized protein n=1 Tax=Pleurodeles waltl TaxID=8319 RepID=A0AAV7SC86_PLEWA|nr:hypothetical protein NDU88_001927 [Pleurodeles waltl]
MEEGSSHPRAWWGLVRAHELGQQVMPPWVLLDPVPGGLPHGELEDEAQDRGSHPDGSPEHDLAGEASPGQPGDLDAP